VETVLTVALWLFAVTNVDTLLVVAAFCVDRDYRTVEVFLGYYAGVVVGLAAAVAGAVLVAGWLRSWSFLLGVVPIAIGVRGLISQRGSGDVDGRSEDRVDESQFAPGGIGRGVVVLVAVIGLSGENLAVYIPFFVGLSANDSASWSRRTSSGRFSSSRSRLRSHDEPSPPGGRSGSIGCSSRRCWCSWARTSS